ncbi:MAG: DUF2569 family protein [Candidatus Acidiferrales bacterium]
MEVPPVPPAKIVVPPTSVPPAHASGTHAPARVRGFLLLVCIYLAIANPLVLLLRIINDDQSRRIVDAVASFEGLSGHIPQDTANRWILFNALLVIDVFLFAFSLLVGVRLWKRRRKADRWARRFAVTMALLAFVGMKAPPMPLGRALPGVTYRFIADVMLAAVVYFYLRVSHEVKATYDGLPGTPSRTPASLGPKLEGTPSAPDEPPESADKVTEQPTEPPASRGRDVDEDRAATVVSSSLAKLGWVLGAGFCVLLVWLLWSGSRKADTGVSGPAQERPQPSPGRSNPGNSQRPPLSPLTPNSWSGPPYSRDLQTEYTSKASGRRLLGKEVPSPKEAIDNGQLFYEDYFDDFHNWIEGVSGPCRSAYTGDGFDLTAVPPSGNCTFNLWEAGYFSGKIRIDVDAKVTSGLANYGYGTMFGQANRNVEESYVFIVNVNGKYALLLSASSGWKTIIPWTANSNVNQGMGAENHLTVEISDRSIRLYANGKYINSAVATSVVRGYMGLYTDEKINTAFRHVRVSEFYGSGGEDPPLSVAFAHKMVGVNTPSGRYGDCVIGRSGDYFTLTRLPSSGAHCVTSSKADLEKVEGAPMHLRIEGTARLLTGSNTGGYGIGFSISDTGIKTEYLFEISGNGSAAVFSVQNGLWRRLADWKQIDLIHTGYQADNHLAIDVLGLVFHCYVNGKYVASQGIPTEDVIDIESSAVDLASLSAGFKDGSYARLIP